MGKMSYSSIKSGKGRPIQISPIFNGRKEYKRGVWGKDVVLPKITVSTCRNAKKRGGSKPTCTAMNVELGNGYCVTCWDKKTSRKVID